MPSFLMEKEWFMRTRRIQIAQRKTTHGTTTATVRQSEMLIEHHHTILRGKTTRSRIELDCVDEQYFGNWNGEIDTSVLNNVID